MLQWLLDIVGGWVGTNLGAILGGLGAAILAGLAFLGGKRSGKKEERQEGVIRAQEEIIDAHETRNDVETATRTGGVDRRTERLQRYTRDE